MIERKVIPPMTDPLGKYWEQPKLDEISFSLRYAWMTWEVFEKLKHYQTSTPTGAYPGKMWKMQAYTNRYPPGHKYSKHEWLLCYYDKQEDRTKPGGRPNIVCPIQFFIINFEP